MSKLFTIASKASNNQAYLSTDNGQNIFTKFQFNEGPDMANCYRWFLKPAASAMTSPDNNTNISGTASQYHIISGKNGMYLSASGDTYQALDPSGSGTMMKDVMLVPGPGDINSIWMLTPVGNSFDQKDKYYITSTSNPALYLHAFPDDTPLVRLIQRDKVPMNDPYAMWEIKGAVPYSYDIVRPGDVEGFMNMDMMNTTMMVLLIILVILIVMYLFRKKLMKLMPKMKIH